MPRTHMARVMMGVTPRHGLVLHERTADTCFRWLVAWHQHDQKWGIAGLGKESYHRMALVYEHWDAAFWHEEKDCPR